MKPSASNSQKDHDTNLLQSQLNIRAVEGQLAFILDCFGNHLASTKGYKKHRGVEALHFCLVEKYHWLPSVVKSLNLEDLRFLFEEDMADWTMPPRLARLRPKMPSLK